MAVRPWWTVQFGAGHRSVRSSQQERLRAYAGRIHVRRSIYGRNTESSGTKISNISGWCLALLCTGIDDVDNFHQDLVTVDGTIGIPKPVD